MASNHLILPPPLPFPPLSLFDPNHTISKASAQNPTLAPKKAAKDLFPKPFFASRLYRRFFIKRDLNKVGNPVLQSYWNVVRDERTERLGG